MQQTANYGFLKPEDNAAFDQQTHANANMDAIDTEIKARADGLAAHLADGATGVHKAKNIALEDTGGHFVSAEVEGALSELFTSVSDGKTQVASAVTDMGQAATGSDTFAQLATKIRDISDDATAAVGDVLTSKTFYQGGTKKTGTMINKVGSATVITPGTADQTIPKGYYGGVVGDGKVAGDADLIAANIKSGVNIFGVTGSFAPQGTQTFTSSGSFIVPTGVCYIDLFMVGGGGSGVGNGQLQSGGGGGGHVSSFVAIPVTPGDNWTVAIGAGGGNTTFVKGGTIYTAYAGSPGTAIQSWGQGGTGGSGGGGGSNSNGGTGGSDGSNGANGSSLAYSGGNGQLNTTRAWGDLAGMLYAGGGGGGSQYDGYGGAGGSGGGGTGGGGSQAGTNGTDNTGGGGGGKGNTGSTYGVGGSGVLLVKWGY